MSLADFWRYAVFGLKTIRDGERDEIIAEGKHVQFLRRGGWEMVRRRNVSGIVGIVAVTDDRKLILVEQYRPPVGKRVIEIPAGLAGDVEGHQDEALEVA